MRFLTIAEQRLAENVLKRHGRLSPAEWQMVGAYLETAPATTEDEYWLNVERSHRQDAKDRAWRLAAIDELEKFGMMTRELAVALREQEEPR